METKLKIGDQIALVLGILGILAGVVLLFFGASKVSGFLALFNGFCLAGVGYINLKKEK